MRPEVPLLRMWSQPLSEILRLCWNQDPHVRPSFEEIDRQVQQLRARFGADVKESPVPRHSVIEKMVKRKSPDMHPIPLPLLPRRSHPTLLTLHVSDSYAADTTASFVEVGSVPSTDVSFITATDMTSSQSHSDHDEPKTGESSRSSSRTSSSLLESQTEHIEFPRHVSPPPPDERAQNLRDERRYRMLLQHEFHPSRKPC